jgi:hypothetical protein
MFHHERHVLSLGVKELKLDETREMPGREAEKATISQDFAESSRPTRHNPATGMLPLMPGPA